MSASKPQSVTEETFPVSVILARDEVQVGRWRAPRWRALGVVAGASCDTDAGGSELSGDAWTRRHPDLSLRSRQVAAEDGQVARLWSGFTLRLYRDSTESYWHNLLGRQPKLFVICRPDDSGELEPCAISANYDEAGAYMEADDTVLSVPMPPEIYRWIEQYVVKYFRPVERKARKRKDWTLETKRHE